LQKPTLFRRHRSQREPHPRPARFTIPVELLESKADVGEEIHRRLLQRLSLGVLVVGLAAVVIREIAVGPSRGSPRNNLLVEGTGAALLVVANWMVRRGSYRVASLAVLLLPVAVVAGLVLVETPDDPAQGAILYLLLPVLLGSTLLTVRQTAWFGIGTIAFGVALPLVASRLRYDAELFAYIVFLAFFTAMSLIIAHHRDQLAQARAAQLRKREEWYRLLAENTSDVVFVQDLEFNPVYLSPAASQVFRYPPEEVRRLGMAELMTSESFERARTLFAEFAASGAQAGAVLPLMQYEYQRRDGSTFWGELRASLVRDEAGKLAGIQGVLRDVTERKQAEAERARLEDQLRQTEKMRLIGQLAGGVAHDFNNQLAGIRGSAELLSRYPPIARDPMATDLAEGIVKSADRSAQLTAQLLAFARRTNAGVQPIDIHEVVDDAMGIFGRSVDKRVKLALALEASSSVILGDSAQLGSALLNVALNARDAMPEGGELGIKSSNLELDADHCQASGYELRPGRYLALAVQDAGVGMDEQTRQRMFEPFFTTKELGKGTGMGLAAVDGTIRAHAGAIAVDTAPGRGTTVTLLLPVTDAPVQPLRPTPAPTERAGEATILLVDDEPVVRAVTAQLLGELGYRVLESSGGAQALELCRRSASEIDLAIVDVVMPDLGGRDLVEQMRAIRPDMRAVLMSGGSAKTAAEVRDPAIRGFLQKPFSGAELAEALADALR
jgi:PAS domain S-box-containing protein